MDIKDYIAVETTKYPAAIVGERMGVSAAMVSAYKLHDYLPSIAVAIRVYMLDKTVLHPYAEDALKKEIAIRTSNGVM